MLDGDSGEVNPFTLYLVLHLTPDLFNISQPFYREKLYESALGFKDLEDFMVNFWEAWALSKGSISHGRQWYER